MLHDLPCLRQALSPCDKVVVVEQRVKVEDGSRNAQTLASRSRVSARSTRAYSALLRSTLARSALAVALLSWTSPRVALSE